MTEEEEARTLSSLKEILPTAAVVCVKEESDTDTDRRRVIVILILHQKMNVIIIIFHRQLIAWEG
jgi:hypothetical protein